MVDQFIEHTVNLENQHKDQHRFEALLNWLESNRDQAGNLYEQVRIKLIRYFEFNGCTYPEELTDDTIQRAARKISEDEVFRPTDPYIYFRGIARNVLLEYWKDRKRESVLIDRLSTDKHPVVNPAELDSQNTRRNEKEKMLECMEYCLNDLPGESRDLFIEYNESEKRVRIENRTLMAKKIGVDISTLRNRIMRIRETLRRCVMTCARK